MIGLTVGLAVLVGVSLGLLGGGGSILTVPLLVYVAGMDAKVAIATSLLVVGVTSVVGAFSHARAGRVQWRTAMLFGASSMIGAYSGGQLTRFIPGDALLVAFAVIMVATAIAMLRGRRSTGAGAPQRRMPLLKTAAIGLALGLVTGTVGAGGGFLVVPALVLLGGLTMPAAVGTSLAIIAMNSFAGLAGYLSVMRIDWAVAAMVTAAAVAGALVGVRFADRINPEVLRRAFGWFVLVMASVVLGQQLNPIVGYVGVALACLVPASAFACNHIAACPLRRALNRHTVTAAAT
ncbi:sulfite exporter TauE/SafE family protein [Mycobacterium crocinum]|uniref:Probable membrane transporter protein n=1 Tax=Mycolicibacterium crocinum TaxID=388459 RepID=A0ABY3TRS1_9MYCO|nr:sulfite exporter TauE/SafE family protein [Mycolicibacterium crocinum]MCV7216463.1 sulfite exporter TauE/SafE family protein [Mycolicibacterium crocinum]ULN41840.1 sulfite exporter TauE/SafE family protein [Mycolicibacterium crocinum]